MKRRLLILAAVAPLLTAIDCYRIFSAQQAAIPAPATDCVADALPLIPEVAQVKNHTRTPGEEAFDVILNDSTARKHRRQITIGHRGDSTNGPHTLWASTTWALLNGPSPAEKQSVATLSGRVLRQLQERCAPGAPAPVTCALDRESLPC